MKSNQIICTDFSDFDKSLATLGQIKPDLILVMASRSWFENCDLTKIYKQIPTAVVLGCSTAGEISKNGVSDETMILSTINFVKPVFKTAFEKFESMNDSFTSGQALARQFDKQRVTSMFVLGKGLGINGSKVVEGIQSEVNKNTIITGGLAGDGALFNKTYVLLNDNVMANGIVALAVYDRSIDIFTGSQGGWKPFGPIRKVTQSNENVLFSIDNKPALQVYKEYLGDQASKLPGSGLLFPLEILDSQNQTSGIIRTILAIDEKNGSITFAGEIGEGKFCRLMHTKNDGLVAGAKQAAEMCLKKTAVADDNAFAVLISCVGRKLVMCDEIDDEIDIVKEILHLNSNMIGFYSYGEISPSLNPESSTLHNQTMTISYFKDAV